MPPRKKAIRRRSTLSEKSTVNLSRAALAKMSTSSSARASFIPGFEAQIEGMKTGESRTIPVTFPENYSAAQFAGKAATFDVTLKGIAAPAETEIGEDFAKSLGFADFGALKDKIRENIGREHQAASRGKMEA